MVFGLTSPAFDDGGPIPPRYTCSGQDLSPPLDWTTPPSGARSFALTCLDPDAPGGTFRHWAIFDIPPEARGLAKGLPREAALPDGTRQARNGFGAVGYGGPCPPRGHGLHHYQFRLLALDVAQLDLGPHPDCGAVEAAARPHVLAAAELVGRFGR